MTATAVCVMSIGSPHSAHGTSALSARGFKGASSGMIAVSSEVACSVMQYVRWITRPLASARGNARECQREFAEHKRATPAPMSELLSREFAGHWDDARSQRTVTL